LINFATSELKVIDTAIANQDTLSPCDCEMLHRYTSAARFPYSSVPSSSSMVA
jgi:hypothetical protein